MSTFNLLTPPAQTPALYLATADAVDASNSLYYLAANAGAAALSLKEAWKLRGAFVIAPTKSDLAGFPVATLQQLAKSLNIPNPGQGPAAIAWLTGSAATYKAASIALVNANLANGTAVVGIQATIAIGPASLLIPAQTLIQIGTAPSATLTLTPARSSSLSVYISQAQKLAANAAVLAFDGPGIGTVSLGITNMDQPLFQVFAFCNPQLAGNQTVANGPDLRYYLAPAQTGGAVTELRFPVFAPASATASNPPSFTLQIKLDPLWPFDAGRTVMTPDLTVSGVPALFELPLFTTTAGAPVIVTPSAVSLYFAQNNSGGYVAPAGTFTLAVNASPAPLLCGLLAQEHFKVNAGDTLTLLPASAGAGGFPALVVGKAAMAADDALVTSSSTIPGAFFTTSWLQYAPAAGASGAYFAQPQPSVSFSSGSLQTSVAAVAAQLATKNTAFTPIPMACHAAAYPPAYSGQGPTPPGWPVGGTQYPTDVAATWPNGSVAATSFDSAEHLGLAPVRYRTLFGNQTGSAAQNPIFEIQGSSGQGATATTQQGFIVELNPRPNAVAPLPPTGTWNSVVLAVYDKESMVLAPPPPAQVLDAQLVNTLLSNQLFMVVDLVPMAAATARSHPVTAAISPMEVGGFAFNFDASAGGQQILVFKFNDALSLNDLINQTAHWNTNYLNSEPAAVQTILQNAVKAAQNANPSVAALFVDFVDRILVEPSWTGVIAFNCAIDATRMPPSLEILIAAAVGKTITAHHFGVEISQVTQQGQQVGIKQSSLFGVIAYDGSPPPPAPDFAFWTETLHVQIHNSSVTQFQAAIQVALNTPFGRAATCPAPANAVKLAGAYQQQGEFGTVTFSEADPGSAVYSFGRNTGLRVLDQLAIKTATLLPGTPTNKGQIIPAQIVMGGTLLFDADPFGRGIDLFGYGTGTSADPRGLDFTGFTLNVTATIGSDGGQTTAAADYSPIKVSAASAALRSGSLVSGLPCQVDAFLSGDALSAGSLQAQSIHVLQLENITVPAPTNPLQPANSQSSVAGQLADAAPTIQVSYTTSSPNFAVTFDLPLGSLGSLADAHASLDTSLILGWGPNPNTPGDDAAAVFIKLPFASVGYGGFNLQGVLKTVFGDANLMQVTSPGLPAKPYVILFNNVQLSVFGIKLPPHVLSDLVVFVPGKAGPMGMCLLAKET